MSVVVENCRCEHDHHYGRSLLRLVLAAARVMPRDRALAGLDSVDGRRRRLRHTRWLSRTLVETLQESAIEGICTTRRAAVCTCRKERHRLLSEAQQCGTMCGETRHFFSQSNVSTVREERFTYPYRLLVASAFFRQGLDLLQDLRLLGFQRLDLAFQAPHLQYVIEVSLVSSWTALHADVGMSSSQCSERGQCGQCR